MTMTMPALAPTATVGALLAAGHEDWMREVADRLSPVLGETADFWSRWALARYLDDRFADRFRVERRLVTALGARMAPGTAEGLAAAAAGVERAVEALIEAGIRRHTRPLTARLARRFIDGLALWCVEVELAADSVDPSELPPGAATLLTGC